MNISIIIKKYASIATYGIGLNRVINRYYYDKILLLTYHRILADENSAQYIQDGMYVNVNIFEKHIKFLKKYYKIIHIKDIPSLINDYKKLNINDKRPYCVLTFDDGWADFYKYAFPIIKKYEVLVTIFLPTSFIGTDRIFWTENVIHLLINRKKNVSLNRSDNTTINWIENLTGDIHTNIEYVIKYMKNMSPEEIIEILQKLHYRWEVPGIKERIDFLSWEQVNEMALSGYINYGSHSVSHCILNKLNEESIFRELNVSKELLIKKDLVLKSFIPFCYPNGGHNDSISRMVKEAGYSLAVTTKNGWNNLSPETNIYTLNRVSIHNDIASTISLFSSKILNIM